MPMSSTMGGWLLAMQSQSLVTRMRTLTNPTLPLKPALDGQGVFGELLLDARANPRPTAT